MQILTATEVISDTFYLPKEKWIILRGTPVAPWMVESRPLGSSDPWELDGDTNRITDKQVQWEGPDELEFRVNLGTGNAGPTVFLYDKQPTFVVQV
jgi:hypothetical protein